MHKNLTQLFVLGMEAISALGEDEIAHTCSALRELNLYALPYDKVTLRLPGRAVLSCGGPKGFYQGLPMSPYVHADFTFSAVEDSGLTCIGVNSLNGYRIDLGESESLASPEVRENTRRDLADLLIALLATRNIVKSTTKNKLAALGIGKRRADRRYSYTTTLSLPRPEDMESDVDHPPTGATRAPHLRRGHIRNQHYGPGGQFLKRIWIAPVFVNADPSFVSKREAYILRIG